MLTIFIIIFILILWAALSTFTYKIMIDAFDIDFDEDPRGILATIFSPISIFIIIGYGLGLLLLKRSDKFLKRITKKFKDE